MSIRSDFEKTIAVLEGKLCWSVIGPSSGSWFSLDIGAEIRRRLPLVNPHLNPKQREFTGEYAFLFKQVGWNIYQNDKIICHSGSSNAPGGQMEKTFPLLESKTIFKIDLGGTPDALEIQFSDGYRILTGAWTTDPTDACYTFFQRGKIYYSVFVSGEIKTGIAKYK